MLIEVKGETVKEMGAVPCSLLVMRRLCRGELGIAWEKAGSWMKGCGRGWSEQKKLSEQWFISEHQSWLQKCSCSFQISFWSLDDGCLFVMGVGLFLSFLLCGFNLPSLSLSWRYSLPPFLIATAMSSLPWIAFSAPHLLAAWSSSSLTLSSSCHIIFSPPTALTWFPPPPPSLALACYSSLLGLGWLSSLFSVLLISWFAIVSSSLAAAFLFSF